MNKLKKFSKKLIKNNKGQGMVEYILLLVIVVGLVLAFKEPIKNAVSGRVDDVSNSMESFSVDK
jgi:Flp pilus assembly pilin Flp